MKTSSAIRVLNGNTRAVNREKMNFWSRTSSKTFNRYSEFHASREAIIRRLTTLAVTCKDIQI